MSGFFIFIGGLFVIAAGAVAFSVSLTDIVIGVVVSGVGIGLLLIAAGVIIARLATLERQILQLHYKDGNENKYTNRAAKVPAKITSKKKTSVAENMWMCECGRVNNDYCTSCACGKNRRDLQNSV